MIAWLAASAALAAPSRYEPSCTCIITEDRMGQHMEGAFPLRRVVELIHDRGEGGTTGLVVRLDDGRELQAAKGDSPSISPVAQIILTLRDVPLVHVDGTPCFDLSDLPPDRAPGEWQAILTDFSGGGQNAQDVAELLADKAKALQTCLPDDIKGTATPLSLDFNVAASGDLNKVTAFSPDVDGRVTSCIARIVDGWQTAAPMLGAGHYAFDVQLAGAVPHVHPGP
jgi:hypothetical protein